MYAAFVAEIELVIWAYTKVPERVYRALMTSNCSARDSGGKLKIEPSSEEEGYEDPRHRLLYQTESEILFPVVIF
jgi:hypothetical protein